MDVLGDLEHLLVVSSTVEGLAFAAFKDPLAENPLVPDVNDAFDERKFSFEVKERLCATRRRRRQRKAGVLSVEVRGDERLGRLDEVDATEQASLLGVVSLIEVGISVVLEVCESDRRSRAHLDHSGDDELLLLGEAGERVRH